MTFSQLRTRILSITFIAMLPLAAVAFMLSDHTIRGLSLFALVMMAGLIAASLSCKRVAKHLDSPPTETPASTMPTSASTTTPSQLRSQNAWNYFRELLDDLSQMQHSPHLPERYHCFVRMVENCLDKSLGATRISLWCPDETYDHLLECVIAPLGEKAAAGTSGLSTERSPCKVPLDAGEIRQALKTGEPYLIGQNGSLPQQMGSMHCHACIPLYRKYGLPLLISVECLPGATVNTQNSLLDFTTAVQLIHLVWDQLQAVNQRQWAIEHEDAGGALRDDIFLQRGEALAQQAANSEELFSVVVLTLHGFRSMFAGHSRLWKDLFALVATAIHHVLKGKNKPFLLGRTADDVFVLMLPQTDEFLARAIMQQIIKKVDEELPRTPLVRDADIMALELAWSIADRKAYQGSLQKMLDRIYRNLFSREQTNQREQHRIVIQPELQETR